MDLLQLFLICACVAVVTALVTGRSTRRSDPTVERLRDDLVAVADKVSSETAMLARRLEGIDARMTHTQTANSELARGIFDALGDVRRATTTVAEQAREFTSLQDLLKAPKARGAIGEAMLEELLRQVLPPHSFEIQHRFSSGTIVDAIVRAGGKIVCIDSKFPLSNHQRMCLADNELERADAERAFGSDVDRHIRDISTRYIVPDEGTFDFAVMYVPAEGVYGEVLRLAHRRRPLFETAIDARVVPMSPLTMYGYLQTILFGLKCLRIEQSAQAILGFCGRLQQDMERFATEYEVLGRHLSNARSKYEEGAHKLDRFRGKLERVTDVSADQLETPRPLEVVGE